VDLRKVRVGYVRSCYVSKREVKLYQESLG
jgi:hypothetical protein